MSKQYVTRTFPGEDIEELSWGDSFGEYEFIKSIHINNTRWHEVKEMIFKFQDKYYSHVHRWGATENQDNDEFENEVLCFEVRPVEVVTIKYKMIEQ